jgi:hypothetical protein
MPAKYTKIDKNSTNLRIGSIVFPSTPTLWQSTSYNKLDVAECREVSYSGTECRSVLFGGRLKVVAIWWRLRPGKTTEFNYNSTRFSGALTYVSTISKNSSIILALV